MTTGDVGGAPPRTPSYLYLEVRSGRRAHGAAAELEIVRTSTLPFELLRIEVLEALVRVDVVRPFVISNPDDPSKPKRKSARVVWAPLDLVVRDLDHRLRTNVVSPSLL